MRTSSAKAKGRRACLETKELLHKYNPDLQPGDVEITSSGACGEDIKLSPKAREKYPFVIECKNMESINIHKAYEQARSHMAKHPVFDLIPVVFFKKNKSDLMVCLDAEDFLHLVS